MLPFLVFDHQVYPAELESLAAGVFQLLPRYRSYSDTSPKRIQNVIEKVFPELAATNAPAPAQITGADLLANVSVEAAAERLAKKGRLILLILRSDGFELIEYRMQDGFWQPNQRPAQHHPDTSAAVANLVSWLTA